MRIFRQHPDRYSHLDLLTDFLKKTVIWINLRICIWIEISLNKSLTKTTGWPRSARQTIVQGSPRRANFAQPWCVVPMGLTFGCSNVPGISSAPCFRCHAILTGLQSGIPAFCVEWSFFAAKCQLLFHFSIYIVTSGLRWQPLGTRRWLAKSLRIDSTNSLHSSQRTKRTIKSAIYTGV